VSSHSIHHHTTENPNAMADIIVIMSSNGSRVMLVPVSHPQENPQVANAIPD
jgi:hypothetical protein